MKVRLQYFPGSTYLHRLHPLVKLAWLVFASLFVFQLRSPSLLVISLLGVLFVYASARLPIRRLQGIRLALSTSILLAIMQMVFNREGSILLSIGKWVLTENGLSAAVRVGVRFLAIILLSYAFVLTTAANDLSYALMQAGLPYRYGFSLVTALRLVPVFQQEADIVYKAQLARGFRYDQFRVSHLLDMMRSFLLPLLVSSLSKVDALAVSMESRCFGMYPMRTYLRAVPFRRGDFLASTLLVLSTILTFIIPALVR
ncbi:MAG: energy-coupling factor transporter transmembrane protein EcfT [Anaerolineales bacterium]|nr:energy-coupling factor transporter transmembrane protein EcfT [Anaerolineales bacterium]